MLKTQLETIYRLLITTGNALQPALLALVRLYWGWQFAQTGWGKLHNLEKVTSFFTDLGIPAPGANAVFVSSLEFFGGILLILGLANRPLGLVLVINMMVAYITADREALLSVISDPGKFYGATPYTFLFAALLVFVFGPGRYSLDAWLGKRFSRS